MMKSGPGEPHTVDYANNDVDAPTNSGTRASHTMVRYSGNLSAGAHTVLVQQQVSNTSTTFRLVRRATRRRQTTC